ncbi:hypothetical protein GCM10020358_70920 [Amorphoplanes nipponensis]
MAEAEAYTSSSSGSRRPAKRDRPACRVAHLASVLAPGTWLAVAIAPGLTIGFVRPSLPFSTAASELKGRPVALTPSRWRSSCGPTTAQTRANTNGLATLMMVNPASASPTAYVPPRAPTAQIPNRSGGTRVKAG